MSKNYQELSLKVRVRVNSTHGADYVVGRIAKTASDAEDYADTGGRSRLSGGGWSVPVMEVERADGAEFGMDEAFENYWDGTHCDGDEGQGCEKLDQRAAFLAGYEEAKSRCPST